MWVESHLELCQITNNQINHNLIKIIQLSLTIFDLWSHSHLWVVGWMDILTFFDIFLKPPQPFIGLFLGNHFSHPNLYIFTGSRLMRFLSSVLFAKKNLLVKIYLQNICVSTVARNNVIYVRKRLQLQRF